MDQAGFSVAVDSDPGEYGSLFAFLPAPRFGSVSFGRVRREMAPNGKLSSGFI